MKVIRKVKTYLAVIPLFAVLFVALSVVSKAAHSGVNTPP
jgi:hypothetical protein